MPYTDPETGETERTNAERQRAREIAENNRRIEERIREQHERNLREYQNLQDQLRAASEALRRFRQ